MLSEISQPWGLFFLLFGTQILYRHKEETKRWIEEYGVNRDDMSNYDLVVDTTKITPQEVGNQVIQAYKKWLEN